MTTGHKGQKVLVYMTDKGRFLVISDEDGTRLVGSSSRVLIADDHLWTVINGDASALRKGEDLGQIIETNTEVLLEDEVISNHNGDDWWRL